MPYSIAKGVIFSFLAMYFVLGFMTSFAQKGEVYPFFSWSLFSYTPNKGEAFTMEITAVGGKVQNPPIAFNETRPLFEKISQSPTQYTPIIRDLGIALAHNKTSAIDLLSKKLSLLFPSGRFSYDILRIEYDPVEYWRSKTYTTHEVLGTFSGEAP
ncbi:MAG: hypothetical protein AAB421_00655 [Patescibacteria group bacterium]